MFLLTGLLRIVREERPSKHDKCSRHVGSFEATKSVRRQVLFKQAYIRQGSATASRTAGPD
jgi:hypothetical protein